MNFREVHNGDIKLRVAVTGAEPGTAPVILCVHGWPELWYSWRHQLAYFGERGFTVAAMDVRGYGGSDKPHEIAAYTMRALTSDVAAVASSLSDQPVILFGHDWGAPIVWNTAILHPERVRAVAGLSVPYAPAGAVPLLDMVEQIYAGRFFYQIYFQEEGKVEAEVSADYRTALRKIYYTLSGDAPQDGWLAAKSRSAPLLQGMEDPEPFPAWMSAADLDVYVDAFTAGGFRGPINRYRAQRLDFEENQPLRGRHITQPACFVGGARDAVRHFVPGMDFFADPGAACDDFRGSTILPGIGHWVQQEAPDATNVALQQFVDGL